ncbi:hypothetical protein [Pyrofollis japonicus]|uniref:hypothetical protein n=1 Tax=Pyrofollis japonicus TaxID=3060460 RepID=UPI00295A6CBE|nr:hypothetical protein [Pyrofollis japonicus]
MPPAVWATTVIAGSAACIARSNAASRICLPGNTVPEPPATLSLLGDDAPPSMPTQRPNYRVHGDGINNFFIRIINAGYVDRAYTGLENKRNQGQD